MSHWAKILKSNAVAYVISDGNYCKVVLSDQQEHCVPYTQKELRTRFNIPLKTVRRGINVNPILVKSSEEGVVKILDQTFKMSRRMKQLWLLCLLLSTQVIYAQNVAPTAVNDTLLVCNDAAVTFSVVNNDYDTNQDRILLNGFTQPLSGNLVARGNKGNFNYLFGNSDTTSFTYTLRDVRFAGVGQLVSNTALVKITGAPQYNYSGTYTGNNIRLTCRSRNTAAVNITGTTREVNQSFTSITLDANQGTVTIAPTSGGAVELSIKK